MELKESASELVLRTPEPDYSDWTSFYEKTLREEAGKDLKERVERNLRALLADNIIDTFKSRFENPSQEIAGSKLTNEELIEVCINALDECSDALENATTDWLRTPAAASALLLLAYYNGDEKRVYGGKTVMSHSIYVAQGTNERFSSMKHPVSLFSALAGMLHDVPENARDHYISSLGIKRDKTSKTWVKKGATPAEDYTLEGSELAAFDRKVAIFESNVLRTISTSLNWANHNDPANKMHTPYLIYVTHRLTDPKDLDGEARRIKQIQVARTPDRFQRIIATVRGLDKIFNTFEDFQVMFDNLVFNKPIIKIGKTSGKTDPEAMEHGATHAERKKPLVRMLPRRIVGEQMIGLYEIMTDCMSAAAISARLATTDGKQIIDGRYFEETLGSLALLQKETQKEGISQEFIRFRRKLMLCKNSLKEKPKPQQRISAGIEYNIA